jgi:predicted NACHT family NTPase
VNGAKEVEIVPFKQKQIEQYIKIWFTNAADYIDNDLVSANGLIRELQNKPQIRGLAQNPLLLSLLCSLYQEKELTLPARRCQIYEKAVLCMLSKWTRTGSLSRKGRLEPKSEC